MRYVKDATVKEWERGDSNDGMLTMNRGIQAVIRVINDIVNHKRVKGVADERNYDSIASGDGTNTISIWDCITLKECKEVVTVGSHWTELFEPLLTRPEEEKISGGKAARTKWIEQVESLQNKLNMPSYSVTTAEFEFIKSVYLWIKA